MTWQALSIQVYTMQTVDIWSDMNLNPGLSICLNVVTLNLSTGLWVGLECDEKIVIIWLFYFSIHRIRVLLSPWRFGDDFAHLFPLSHQSTVSIHLELFGSYYKQISLLTFLEY